MSIWLTVFEKYPWNFKFWSSILSVTKVHQKPIQKHMAILEWVLCLFYVWGFYVRFFPKMQNEKLCQNEPKSSINLWRWVLNFLPKVSNCPRILLNVYLDLFSIAWKFCAYSCTTRETKPNWYQNWYHLKQNTIIWSFFGHILFSITR